jgi:ribosomal protein S18 acetylase RimI-like enzyme
VTVLLRTANDLDLEAVGSLHYRSRTSAYQDIVSPQALTFGSEGALGEWWSERVRWEKDTHRLTVAVSDDVVVGFSYVGPSPTPGVRELYAIHVDPDFVGTGVGRLLMADALRHLGARAVLWVLEGNTRARAFYEKGGWEPDGETREAPMGGDVTYQLRYTRKIGVGD